MSTFGLGACRAALIFSGARRHQEIATARMHSPPKKRPKFRMDRIVRELVEEAWEWARLGRIGGFPDRDVVLLRPSVTSNPAVMR